MKWGLLSYGRIAQKFIENLNYLDPNKLGAIATRSNINEVKSEFTNIPSYMEYKELVRRSDINCVYISSTHNFHKEQTILALEHGKHVLCEKPLATNFEDANEMFVCAEANDRLLMEAMWTRFLPAYQKMKSLLESGEIGEVKYIKADFGFSSDLNNIKGRLLNPYLAGGSVYDIGIYPIALALDLFEEEPSTIQVMANTTHLGVDIDCSVQMEFSENRFAQLFSSFAVTTSHQAIISGTQGRIILPVFWKGQEVIIEKGIDRKKVYTLPYRCTGFVHEIISFENSVKNAEKYNPVMHKKDSLMIAKTIDRIYGQISS